MSIRPKLPSLVATAVLLVSAGRSIASENAQYVALGSSFAAGPGIGVRDQKSPPLCRRSASDYPHLYADKHHLALEDRTCSGATTTDVLQAGQFGLPSQIDAITPATRLVTITIGGNDVFYLRSLIAESCARSPEKVPDFMRNSWLCKGVSEAEVDAAFPKLGQQLEKIVDQARKRAPRARLVFVNYFTVLPRSGRPCAGLSLSAAEIKRGRDVAERLLRITFDVARKTCTDLIDAAALSADHDVCADRPWMQSFAFPPDKSGFAPFAYHPTVEAMQAVVDELDRKSLLGSDNDSRGVCAAPD